MKARTTALVLADQPQVNLLPPEVRAARTLRVVKRWLGISLVFVVVLLAGVFGLSLLRLGIAETELAAAQADTATLQNEEKKYAEVPAVLTALEAAETVRELGMSTEVSWKPYLDAVTAVLPAEVSLKTITYTGATPETPAATPASPLLKPSVGVLQFSGRSLTLPDTAAMIDALNSVPGFSDAWVTAAAITEADGTVFYEVESSVQVTDVAYAHRFVVTDEEQG